MSVEKYINTAVELSYRDNKLKRYAAMLIEIGELLMDATNTAALTDVGLPTLSTNASYDNFINVEGRELPSLLDIERELMLFHGSYNKLQDDWQKLTSEERRDLPAPPLDIRSFNISEFRKIIHKSDKTIKTL